MFSNHSATLASTVYLWKSLLFLPPLTAVYFSLVELFRPIDDLPWSQAGKAKASVQNGGSLRLHLRMN